MSLSQLIGLSGVAKDENPDAIKWAKYLEAPMIFVAFAVLFEWIASRDIPLSTSNLLLYDWVIWFVFVLETVSLTFIVTNKRRYLLTNWLNLVIIFSGVLLIWDVNAHIAILRVLRIILLFGLLAHLSKTWKKVLSRNQLGYTLLLSFLIVFISGALVSGFDPAIETVWDGVWWAWVTITTVGYGDIVPASGLGKFFGSLLILLGIGLFAMLTANISAFLIGRDEDKEQLEILKKLNNIEERLKNIEQQTKIHEDD